MGTLKGHIGKLIGNSFYYMSFPKTMGHLLAICFAGWVIFRLENQVGNIRGSNLLNISRDVDRKFAKLS